MFPASKSFVLTWPKTWIVNGVLCLIPGFSLGQNISVVKVRAWPHFFYRRYYTRASCSARKQAYLLPPSGKRTVLRRRRHHLLPRHRRIETSSERECAWTTKWRPPWQCSTSLSVSWNRTRLRDTTSRADRWVRLQRRPQRPVFRIWPPAPPVPATAVAAETAQRNRLDRQRCLFA